MAICDTTVAVDRVIELSTKHHLGDRSALHQQLMKVW